MEKQQKTTTSERLNQSDNLLQHGKNKQKRQEKSH